MSKNFQKLPDDLGAKLAIMYMAVESSNCPIVVTDADPSLDNPIVYANNAYCELSGFDLEFLIGKNPRFMHGPYRNQKGLDEIRQALLEKKPVETVILNCRRDLTPYWCQVNISPVTGGLDDRVLYWVSVQKDVSDFYRLEALKSDLTSMLLNEIKSPMSSANTILRELRSAVQSNDLAIDSFEALANTNSEVVRLVDNIVDILNSDTGDFAVRMQLQRLAPLIEDCVEQIRPLAAAREIEVNLEIEDNINSISMDARLIRRALMNLFDNAIKYSDTPGAIAVRGKIDLGCVLISIENTGSEFSEERPVDRFFRVLPGERLAGNSSELGLYLSRQFITLHNGVMTVSTTESGTCITVRLPLKKAAEECESGE